MLYENKLEPIRVTKCKNFDFVLHMHHHIEIFICTKGIWKIQCNCKIEQIKVGDVMIAFSNDVHSYLESSDGEGIMVIFDPSLLSNFQFLLDRSCFENFLIGGALELISLCQSLYEEYTADRNMQILIGYLYVIFGKILRLLPRGQKDSFVSSSHFSEVLKFIAENYTKKISLNILSQKFGISTEHLSRCFTQKLSCNFLGYLHMLRVYRAQELLRDSQMSILEIVYESGFSDQRSFNRVFKKISGCTPREYREGKAII